MKHLMLFEEWHKVIQHSNSGKTKWIDTIHDGPSSPKSYSSSLLLKNDLEEKEFDDLKKLTGASDWVIKNLIKYPSSSRKNKLEQISVTMNNLKFLKDIEKEKGELYCEYCKKGPLVIYDINPGEITPENIDNRNFRFNAKFNPKDGATADHKQPQSKGGDKFDYSNLAVSCEPCNKRKGNMDWESWKQRIKL